MNKREASRIIAQLHKDWKADGTRLPTSIYNSWMAP